MHNGHRIAPVANGDAVTRLEESTVIRQRVRDGLLEQLTVRRTETGWLVLRERDRRLISEITHSDWHRVERALQVFDLPERPPPETGLQRQPCLASHEQVNAREPPRSTPPGRAASSRATGRQ